MANAERQVGAIFQGGAAVQPDPAMVVQGLMGLRTEPAEGTDALAASGGTDDMDTNIQRKRGAEEQGSQNLPADINDMHPDEI